MGRVIFFARKWKHRSTTLPLTVGGGGGGGAILDQNLRNLKVSHTIPDLPTTRNSAASK